MRIYKEFLFEAAHFLPSAPPGHPNSRIHGHSFRARVTIDGEPDPTTGVLLHFDDIEAALAEAREALEQILKNDIDVILIDVIMPDLDGFQLAAMIRDHPRFQKTAMIFVSAIHLTDMDRLRGYEMGALKNT